MRTTSLECALGMVLLVFMTSSRSLACIEGNVYNQECWSSCGLANCGLEPTDQNASIKCSWRLTDDGFTRNSNVTSFLQFDYRTQCDPSVHACNSTTFKCTDTFYIRDCESIREKFNREIDVMFDEDQSCKVNGFSRFQICAYGKPDPPIINAIYREKQNLVIATHNQTCPEHGIELKLEYNWTRGDAIHNATDTDKETHMMYKESTSYNFSLRATKDKNVYSEPVHGSYTTAPENAFESGSLNFMCIPKTKKEKTRIVWEKHGIINYFNVTVINQADGTMVYTAILNSTSPSQTYYYTTAAIKDRSQNHTILITAHNDGGVSKTHREEFRPKDCTIPTKIKCHVISKGESWMKVGWTITGTGSNNYDVEFVDPYHSNEHIGDTLTSDSKRRTWNQTGLNTCTQYDISVCARDAQCCKIHQFTNGPGPRIAPNFEVKQVKSRSIKINLPKHTQINDSEACGIIKGYYIAYRVGNKTETLKIDKDKRRVSLPNLMPNTEYFLSVALMTDDEAIGVNRTHEVKTLEAAPDHPPTIRHSSTSSGTLRIEWNPPDSCNGDITHYELRVHVREGASSEVPHEQSCKITDDGYLCILPPRNTTAILGIRGAEQVEIRACAVNGTQCSEWSEEANVVENDTGVSTVLIILSIVCGIMLLLVIVIGTIYRIKSQGPKPPKAPRMHPLIAAEFEAGNARDSKKDIEVKLLEDNTRKNSIQQEKKM